VSRRSAHVGSLLEVCAVTALFLASLVWLSQYSWQFGDVAERIFFVAWSVIFVGLILRIKRERFDYVERNVVAMARSLGIFLLWSALIFPPYLLLANGWMRMVYGANLHWSHLLTPAPIEIVLQLLIAASEEIYFRGYVQTTLKAVFHPRWRLFGVSLGWEWPLTAIIFAASHSVLMVQWWHFAIFFPALAFGFLRARTNGLVAPILFHALSNLVLQGIVMNYG